MVDYISNVISKANSYDTQRQKESELYEVTNSSSILANGIFQFNLEAMPYEKYLPFNYVQVQNNSAQKTRLIVNDTIRKLIPAGTIQSFDSSTTPAVWSIKIENLSSTTAIGAEEISVAFQKLQNVPVRQVKLFGGSL